LRIARAIFALYVVAWFNVVVPGHTRGLLTMPGGSDRAQTSGKSCCAGCPTDSNQPQKPTPDQKRRCAVCYVAANYTVPVVYFLDLNPADCVEVANLAAVAQVCSLDFPAPYWPVGPPTML
jgi:hypothetical protein